MQKLFSLILALMLILTAAASFAEVDDPVLTNFLPFAAQGVEEMKNTDSAWITKLMDHAEISSISYLSSNYVQADLKLPRLTCDTSASTLADALKEYITPTSFETYQLTATWEKNEDGTVSYNWGMHSPKKLSGSIDKQIAAAKRGYNSQEFRTLLQKTLLPHTTSMPEKKDTDFVAKFRDLDPAFVSNAAKALNLTEEQAAQRLQVPMMLMTITKLDLSKGLTDIGVTMRVYPWKTLMDRAIPGAKAEVDATLGAPELTRAEIETIYGRHLSDALIACYYAKRSKSVEYSWTMDLTKAAEDGLCSSEGLLTYLGDMMTYLESKVDEVEAYARTLPYYPVVDMADTGVFSGEMDKGTHVTFDMGSRSDIHAYLVISQNGTELGRAFVNGKVPLTVKLQPGVYDAAFGMGADWHGEKYVFGKEGTYGKFIFVVDETGRTIVHLENTDGPLTITPLEWQDLSIER